MECFNIWYHYGRFIKQSFPDLNPKLQNNIISFTHTITTIVWITIHQLYEEPKPQTRMLALTLYMSVGYYLYDLKNYTGHDEMSYIMYYHHVGSCALISLGFVIEPVDLSIAFLIVEISNIPLYFTQIILHSSYREDLRRYLKVCIMVELAFFLVFRCIVLLVWPQKPQSDIINAMMRLVHLASVMWSYKLGLQLLRN